MNQFPVQHQNIYPTNYVIPIQQNQNQNQDIFKYFPQTEYQTPIEIQNVYNIPQTQNFQRKNENKRKTYTPGQYKKGQIIFQNPEPVIYQQIPSNQQPNGQKKFANSQRYPFEPKIPKQEYIYPQAQIYETNPNSNPTQQQMPVQPQKNYKKTPTMMTVNTLANLHYSEYTEAEYSHKPFYNICAYAFNSYNGKVRDYNEDTTKTIVNYPKKVIVNGKIIAPHISYFAVFDGHGGKKCSEFLRDKLDYYILNSKYFPAYPIQAVKEGFINAEKAFMGLAIDRSRNQLVDKSGSCALVVLIINDALYAINLGDCRALMSTNSGQYLYQITRDHKPNDEIERRRIERSGAKVYYANKIVVDGEEVEIKESDFEEGFKIPYRISPGGIAVSIYF